MNFLDIIKKEILQNIKNYYFLNEIKKEKIQCAGRVYDEKEIQNLIDSSLEFFLTAGKYANKFEQKLAKFLNIKYCHLVNSGSSANLLAFMTLTSPLLKERQIKRKDEIITIACCFPTTISPIIQYDAIPVFVDINLQTVNIDVNQLEKALSIKTKAIIIAHTLGNPFNIKVVKDFCIKHNLWLIEDNCDSLGSKYQSKYTGTFGDIGTSSFYPAHHITTGEGGAIYTNNDQLSKILLSLRDWGRDCQCDTSQDNKCRNRFNRNYKNLPYGYDHKYVYSNFGYNLKITDMQAAIGCAQLDKLILFIEKRKENWRKLYEGLKCLDNYLIFQQAETYSIPSWFGFLIIIKNNTKFSRNNLAEYLEKNKIQTRNLFAGNITKHPCFDSFIEGKDYKIIGNLDNSNKIMNDSLWIGCYPGINNENINYMIKTIKNYFK